LNTISGKITVKHIGGNISSESDFTVIPPAFTFSPPAGSAGLMVTITGSGFNPSPTNNIVMFNGVPASVVNATNSQLGVLVPSGATTGKISVTVSGSTITSANDFVMINPPAVLINIQPTSGIAERPGIPGTRVVINGSNFSQLPFQNMIRFGGGSMVPAMFSTTNRLEVIVPSGATSVPVTVIINGMPSVGNVVFTVVP